MRLSADFGYLKCSAASIILDKTVLVRGIVTINKRIRNGSGLRAFV